MKGIPQWKLMWVVIEPAIKMHHAGHVVMGLVRSAGHAMWWNGATETLQLHNAHVDCRQAQQQPGADRCLDQQPQGVDCR